MVWYYVKRTEQSVAPTPSARVVELVDSLASGASARKGVRVRLPPRAPNQSKCFTLTLIFFCSKIDKWFYGICVAVTMACLFMMFIEESWFS